VSEKESGSLSEPFLQAFEHLMSRAPGPIFPRARTLYLRKYSLETDGEGAFRTFLLEEEILESPQGTVTSRALAFAVVHWQAPQVDRAAYAAYLAERWCLAPHDLTLVPEQAWFRDGGAWARFSLPMLHPRNPASRSINPADGRDGPADPGGAGA